MRVRASVAKVAVSFLIVLLAQQAQAQGRVELGGKKSFSFLAAINAESQFASAVLVASADFSFISASGRYEAGGGIKAVGLLAGPATLAAYLPYVTVRRNSNLFGAQENMLSIGDGFEDTVAVGNTFSVGSRFLF
jgi:hypothetical protein